MQIRPITSARKEFASPDTSCFIRVAQGTDKPQKSEQGFIPDFTQDALIIRAGGAISATSDKSITTPIKATKAVWYVNNLALDGQTGVTGQFTAWTFGTDYEFSTAGGNLDLIIHKNIEPGENINISAKVTAIDPRQGTGGNSGADIDMMTDTLPISCVQATVASVLRLNVTRSDFGHSYFCDDKDTWDFYYANACDDYHRSRIAQDIGLPANATKEQIQELLMREKYSADPQKRLKWSNDSDYLQRIGVEMTEGGAPLDARNWKLEIRNHKTGNLLFSDFKGGLQHYVALGQNEEHVGLNLLDSVLPALDGNDGYRTMKIDMRLCGERTVLDLVGYKPDRSVVDTREWSDRFVCEHPVENPNGCDVANLNKIQGCTVKNLVKNGDFSDGTDGWSTTASVTTDSVAVHGDIRQNVSLIASHKYFFSHKAKSQNNTSKGFSIYNSSIGYLVNFGTLPQSWATKSAIATPSVSVEFTIRQNDSASLSDLIIDKHYGVRLYDLTELGLDNILTTAEQCEEFFSQYADGVQGTALRKLVSTGANLFDKESMVLEGKGIDADGNIVAMSGKKVLCVPVLKSKTGTGKNNGYRIHGCTVEKVGWNPYPTDNGCFDKVYDIASPSASDVDYSQNTMDGYLYIQTANTANVDNVVVHAKFGQTSFSSDWYNERKDYWKSELPLPVRYIDGEGNVQEVTELHGLTDGTNWYRDEVDLVERKYIKRCFKVTIEENSIFEVAHGHFYMHLSIKGNTAVVPVLSEKYTWGGKIGWENDYSNVTLSSDLTKILFADAGRGIDKIKEYLNGSSIIYAIEVPVEYPLADDTPDTYAVNDLGMERLEYEGGKPMMETEYFNSNPQARKAMCQATFYPDERPYQISWSQPVMDDELTKAPIEVMVTVNGEQQACPERVMNFGLYAHHPTNGGNTKDYGAPYGGTNPSTPIPQITASRGIFDLTPLNLSQTDEGSTITVEMGEAIRHAANVLADGKDRVLTDSSGRMLIG